MRRARILACFVLVLFCVLLLPLFNSGRAPQAQTAGAAGGNYAYCYAGSGQPVTYFSEVFEAPALQGNPPPHMAVVNRQGEVNRSWISFLEKNHAPSELQFGNCPIADLHTTQTSKQQLQDKFKQENKQIVETSWKYTPDDPAANAAPAPSSTAEGGYYVYCYSANLAGSAMYFSDVFAFNAVVSPNDGRKVGAKVAGPFLAFLQKKYAIKVDSSFYPASWNGTNYPTQCSGSFTPLQAAREAKQQVEDNLTKNLHRQIVETGWTYTP